ncbi:carbon storage regulator CsrA [Marinomonas primoryensis]|jgi:carbon storage regulator|uniref:carbon storage regulator CsrA n=1 Tax=Marinomonas primoryensis TaxID=178399 RepID=UPI0030DC9A60|tara:strand:+ start:2950 stop:3147 length:198 start_codon:yes stop_codon:yes gene_type:complete
MLILTRRINETINIDNNIQVKIISVKGGQVRIGVTAPKNVIVHREEIYKLIEDQKRQVDNESYWP